MQALVQPVGHLEIIEAQIAQPRAGKRLGRLIWGSNYTHQRITDRLGDERPRTLAIPYAETLKHLLHSERIALVDKRMLFGSAAQRLIDLPDKAVGWGVTAMGW
jgi:hypothetical protein